MFSLLFNLYGLHHNVLYPGYVSISTLVKALPPRPRAQVIVHRPTPCNSLLACIESKPPKCTVAKGPPLNNCNHVTTANHVAGQRKP